MFFSVWVGKGNFAHEVLIDQAQKSVLKMKYALARKTGQVPQPLISKRYSRHHIIKQFIKILRVG